jgi:hypothetical protein
MPIGPLPPGCIAVCAPRALDIHGPIEPQSGVCQIQTDGLVLSDVVVTACTIASVDFTEITEREVGVTVSVEIAFTFTGTINGFTFHGRGSCTDSLFFVQRLLPPEHRLVQPLDCAAEFVCQARSVGFDPATGIQTFIIHLEGTLTCVGCLPAPYTIVQVCPAP